MVHLHPNRAKRSDFEIPRLPWSPRSPVPGAQMPQTPRGQVAHPSNTTSRADFAGGPGSQSTSASNQGSLCMRTRA